MICCGIFYSYISIYRLENIEGFTLNHPLALSYPSRYGDYFHNVYKSTTCTYPAIICSATCLKTSPFSCCHYLLSKMYNFFWLVGILFGMWPRACVINHHKLCCIALKKPLLTHNLWISDIYMCGLFQIWPYSGYSHGNQTLFTWYCIIHVMLFLFRPACCCPRKHNQWQQALALHAQVRHLYKWVMARQGNTWANHRLPDQIVAFSLEPDSFDGAASGVFSKEL